MYRLFVYACGLTIFVTSRTSFPNRRVGEFLRRSVTHHEPSKPMKAAHLMDMYLKKRIPLDIWSLRKQTERIHIAERPNIELGGDCVHKQYPGDTFQHHHSHQRLRRQSSSLHEVELIIILDYALYLFWLGRNNNDNALTKAEMTDYYINIVSAADKRYTSVTRGGFRVKLLINDIIIAETSSMSPWTQKLNVSGVIQAGKALDDFSAYVERSGGQIDGVPFDHVALITGFDLASGSKRGTAGIAYLSAVCRSYTVSVTEELFDEFTGLVLAHEIGHSLGSEHDGVQNTCRGRDHFVMAAGLRIPPTSKSRNPWLFSSCSVSQFRTFLSTSRARCTLSRQGVAMDLAPFLQQAFGQTYPPDIQCEIYLGAGSKLCRTLYFTPNTLRYNSVCRLLYCFRPSSGDCIPLSAHDGTSCGDRLWCQSGVCVMSDEAPSTPLNCPAGDDPDVRCTFDLCTNPLFGDQLCCATCSRPRPRPRPTMSGGGEIVVTQSVGIISLNPTQSVMGFSSQTRRLEPTQFVLFSYVESEQSVL